MNEKINVPRAALCSQDLTEALYALKYDAKSAEIHRDDVERHFFSLAKELGIPVVTVGALQAAE